MAAISAFQANEVHLMALRAGHWVIYAGADWQVNDYSTYTDPQGYQLWEWELTAPRSGNTYYLLREVAAAEAICWYMSQPVKTAKIFLPNSSTPVTSLWAQIRWGETPPETLTVYGKTYCYDSQTRGSYGAEGDGAADRVERVTWDYWDADRQRNLAIETWPDGRLEMYIAQVIDPQTVVVQPRGLQDFPAAIGTDRPTGSITTVSVPTIADPNRPVSATEPATKADLSLQSSLADQSGRSRAAIAMQSLSDAKEAAINRELAWQFTMAAIAKIIFGFVMLGVGLIVLLAP